MTEYEWEAICSLWGIRLTAAQRAAGCPDAFEPYELAIMQRPVIRTSPTRAAELKSQRDILARIDAAVTAGTLHASTKARMVPTTKTVTVENYATPRSAWVTAWGFPPRPPMVTKTVKTGERQEEYKVIDRAAFRDWLNSRGEPPSEHVRAWLDSTEVKAASRPASKPKGQDSPDARLELILAELEKRATENGEPFSVDNMPGLICEFHELCKRLDPVFKHSLESFKRYQKRGRCKWPGNAKSNPSAEPLYCRLFPEAWGAPGAVSANRAKM